MNPIENILSKYKLMILDGAFATELEARGFNISDELWSANALISRPDLVKSVHLDYLKAGADAIISASYQATVEGFIKRGMSHDEAVSLIKLSVELAKEVRNEFWSSNINKNRPEPLVAASVGPYGAFLADGSEYRGDYKLNQTELENFHRERLSILASAEPDIFACETIPCLIEAKAVVNVLKNHPDFYAWITFSCKDDKHISDGELIADCAKWLDKQSQVAAIGLNCTAPQYVESLIKEIKANTDKPVIVYPNSGETYDATTKSWQGSPVTYADYAEIWYDAGAEIIGGCCRTTPKDIKSIANTLRN